MAAIANSNLALFSAASSTTTALTTSRRIAVVRCGPRDNRGPLHKGRILSTEAIQAIQSLKRAYRSDPTNLPTHLLRRLLKSDLTAALKELLRQEQCAVAASVFSVIQSEYGADLNMYAEMVVALARNGLTAEIDSLVDEMEKEAAGIVCGESRGLLRLVKALIGAGRKESTVRIYRMMKRSGVGSTWEMDEYLGRNLSKGLRRFGEGELADEVDLELARLYKAEALSLSLGDFRRVAGVRHRRASGGRKFQRCRISMKFYHELRFGERILNMCPDFRGDVPNYSRSSVNSSTAATPPSPATDWCRIIYRFEALATGYTYTRCWGLEYNSGDYTPSNGRPRAAGGDGWKRQPWW